MDFIGLQSGSERLAYNTRSEVPDGEKIPDLQELNGGPFTGNLNNDQLQQLLGLLHLLGTDDLCRSQLHLHEVVDRDLVARWLGLVGRLLTTAY